MYRENNNSEVEDPNLSAFFEKHNFPLFTQEATEEEEKVLEAFKIFIEQTGKPFNYQTHDQEKEDLRKEEVENKIQISE